ncbi:quinate dehydrogenase [Rhizodiscina lignyota]|uniref:Quinate dehydrogenase n=1 Tax=Rhizodiscina lignyota TaxID=1504668 RepID=A0A9P4IG87_9PEZI|nr:quinate dehydrogenase [Rhizodiscina lignyota]
MPSIPSLPKTDHLDGVGYLFGAPIAHSMSPLLHGTVYRFLGLNWEQFLLESLDIPMFINLINDSKCFGASVTMPHKLAIIPYLDDLTPEGRDVGAVNTIFFREKDGKKQLIGTNTDIVGIRESFYRNVSNPDAVFHKRPGMVVGGGGAARSAVYALQRWMKCSPIYMVNRDRSEVADVISECKSRGFGDDLIDVATLKQAETLEGPGAIVACIPDFEPKTAAEKEARSVLQCMLNKPHKGAILEMAYHPSPWTTIGRLSQEAGWRVILGTESMIYQGFEQNRYWTGKSIDEMNVEECREVIAAKLREAKL